MVLKINEPNNSVESNNFAAKLKELDRQTSHTNYKASITKSIKGIG